jgi:hypothetical protein
MDVVKDKATLWLFAIVVIVCISMGFIAGLFLTSEGGVYCSLKLGENKEFKMFDALHSLIKLELKNITGEQVNVLAHKIESLAENSELYKKLRDIMLSNKGPFKMNDINVTIKISHDENLGGRTAGACMNMEYFGYNLTVSRINSPQQFANTNIGKRMWEIDVIQEIQQNECGYSDGEMNVVWIKASKAQEILNINNVEDLPEKLEAIARPSRKIREVSI